MQPQLESSDRKVIYRREIASRTPPKSTTDAFLREMYLSLLRTAEELDAIDWDSMGL